MADTTVGVDGTVAPGFEGVREAFEANFEQYGDKGASVGVYVDGEKKVDLWGGVADVASGKPWTEDTLGIVYSVTKGASAILAHKMAQAGELDFDAKVTDYWPEFGGGGKGDVPVRYLFTHQVGLPYLGEPLTIEEVLEGTRIVEVLEQQTPIWDPGSAHGYHALTYGWLVGALITKIKGKSLGKVFAEEIAGPLGLDFYIGLPADQVDRVATLVNMPPPDPNAMDAITDPELKATLMTMGAAMMDPNSTFSRALSTNGVLPTPQSESWNRPEVYASEMPGANGISNGSSLARLYAATVSEVDGVRLLNDETVAAAKVEQVNGPDETLVVPSRFGTGFMLPSPANQWLSDESFGHPGAGGAIGFADTKYKVGFGYVMTQLGGGPTGDPRTQGLINAVREAVS
jgi:CubicO group peptidase (beta-lactamase class C family)